MDYCASASAQCAVRSHPTQLRLRSAPLSERAFCLDFTRHSCMMSIISVEERLGDVYAVPPFQLVVSHLSQSPGSQLFAVRTLFLSAVLLFAVLLSLSLLFSTSSSSRAHPST
ncbi:hypothetical protein BDW72DRAFT_170296 [Aspergillus terricola var. indicus]